MGSPKYPTEARVEALRRVAQLGPTEAPAIDRGRLRLLPMGLAAVEVR